MPTSIRNLLVAALVVSAGLIGAASLTAQGKSTIARGAELAPVPLNMTGLTPALVREGSYIVNAQGACNDCHTVPAFAPGGDPFLGQPEQINAPCYLAGGAAFGPFVSRDITPWEDEKPAGLTLTQFKHVMRTGEDPDNPGQVLHVMPWPVYQEMVDHDLQAIYKYLSSIPAIPANTCGVPSEE